MDTSLPYDEYKYSLTYESIHNSKDEFERMFSIVDSCLAAGRRVPSLWMSKRCAS